MYTICFLYVKASESYEIRETFFSSLFFPHFMFDCDTTSNWKVFQLLLYIYISIKSNLMSWWMNFSNLVFLFFRRFILNIKIIIINYDTTERSVCFLLCLYTIICSIPVSMFIEMKIKTWFCRKTMWKADSTWSINLFGYRTLNRESKILGEKKLFLLDNAAKMAPCWRHCKPGGGWGDQQKFCP